MENDMTTDPLHLICHDITSSLQLFARGSAGKFPEQGSSGQPQQVDQVRMGKTLGQPPVKTVIV